MPGTLKVSFSSLHYIISLSHHQLYTPKRVTSYESSQQFVHMCISTLSYSCAFVLILCLQSSYLNSQERGHSLFTILFPASGTVFHINYLLNKYLLNKYYSTNMRFCICSKYIFNEWMNNQVQIIYIQLLGNGVKILPTNYIYTHTYIYITVSLYLLNVLPFKGSL